MEEVKCLNIVNSAMQIYIYIFFLYQLTVGASRHMGRHRWTCLACNLAQVFRFFIVTPQMFTFSLEHVENVRG